MSNIAELWDLARSHEKELMLLQRRVADLEMIIKKNEAFMEQVIVNRIDEMPEHIRRALIDLGFVVKAKP